ncbi:MAG TPA: MFS transporter [Trebonia sp.]|jgi:putative MFS transporter|nr:MFS transporter [Trebonia sp.]
MTTSTPAARPGIGTDDRRFLRRLTIATSWGEGLDGFDLGIISVVIGTIGTDLRISSWMLGLIGASSLIGIFIGGPIFGYLTDRFGRRRLFTFNIALFIVAGIAQMFVFDSIELFIVRLILGIAIGAEYAIGAPMLAEFCPAASRGKRLSLLEVCWYAGFLISVILGYILVAMHVDWRWILGTSVIPAILTFILRYGLPESPRWLMSRGRTEEARRIVERHFGEGYFNTEDFAGEAQVRKGLTQLFAKEYRGRTIFVCVFWACLVAPYFAIFTFAPVVLDSLHLADARAATISENAVALIGVVAGLFLIEKIGRRQMLISPFWIQAAALLILGVWSSAPVWIVVAAFAVYSFFNAFSGNLTAVYPAEIFGTEVRTSGVGLASAASRVGAAAGTWLLPVGLDHWGVGPCMLIAAAMCAIGAVLSQFMAPETTGRSLTAVSRASSLTEASRAGV